MADGDCQKTKGPAEFGQSTGAIYDPFAPLILHSDPPKPRDVDKGPDVPDWQRVFLTGPGY
ncbi:MAG: hypothetical protein AB8B83_05340 [Bdellovibrionales bacterium]